MSQEPRIDGDAKPSRLNQKLPLAIGVAALVGIALAWLLPSDWFLNVFFVSIAATLLLGVGAAVAANDNRPLPSAVKVFSFLAIGTSRPNAEVPSNMTTMLFQLAASFTVGIGVGMVLLARL